MSIKEKLIDYFDRLNTPASGIVNPDRKSNVGTALYNVFIWQEIASIAEKEEKEAWAELDASRLIPTDDRLRQTEGERIEAESKHFSLLVKVSKPRQTNDIDAFIALVAKKHKIPKSTLEAYAELTKKVSKASLSKKVLEV